MAIIAATGETDVDLWVWPCSRQMRGLRGAGMQVNSPVRSSRSASTRGAWDSPCDPRAAYDCQPTASTTANCRARLVYVYTWLSQRICLGDASRAAFGRGRGRIYQSTLCRRRIAACNHASSGRTRLKARVSREKRAGGRTSSAWEIKSSSRLCAERDDVRSVDSS